MQQYTLYRVTCDYSVYKYLLCMELDAFGGLAIPAQSSSYPVCQGSDTVPLA